MSCFGWGAPTEGPAIPAMASRSSPRRALPTSSTTPIVSSRPRCATPGASSRARASLDEPRVAVIESALARCAEDDLAARARLLARLAEESYSGPEIDSFSLCRAALETAEASADEGALVAAVLANLHHWVEDNLAERIDLIERYRDRVLAGPQRLRSATGSTISRRWRASRPVRHTLRSGSGSRKPDGSCERWEIRSPPGCRPPPKPRSRRSTLTSTKPAD